MQKLSLTKTVDSNDPATACDFLAACTALSKSRIKDAVWLKKQKSKQQRLRRATADLKPGDILPFIVTRPCFQLSRPALN